VDSVINAALASWPIDIRTLFILTLMAIVFVRGWMRGRRVFREHADFMRLMSFLGGLLALFLATQSPLDAFDQFSLSAHMAQHLLLLMIAPPLLLMARPLVPLLRGLPQSFLKDGLAPFLSWHPLRKVFSCLVSPPVAFTLFAVSSIGWHLPGPYELALSSPAWHGLEHACFFWTGILFWWHVIQPGPGKRRWPKWTVIPYLVAGDVVNTIISASLVFSGKVIYPSYAKIHYSSFTPLEDQILAGAIMWVPGSIIYLVPVVIAVVQLLSPGKLRTAPSFRKSVARRLSHRNAHDDSFLPLFRRLAQITLLCISVGVITDGLFGPQVGAVNMAGVLPWIHWRALSVFALLIIGNLFCMSCPFTLVRDMARKLASWELRWPRYLRNKWLSCLIFFVFLWSYEAFSLWDNPRITAWMIVGYFAAAVLVDVSFRGASFCKYVCPIGQFHFVVSLISPREVAVKYPGVCRSCRTHDCIRGNDRARGCELFLFQPKKAGNFDCTFCMDCVKACPENNVSLLALGRARTLTQDVYRSSVGRLSNRTDIVALALLVVFGAFVNAAGMIEPVMAWEHSWHQKLGTHTLPLIIAAFLVCGMVLLPAFLFLLAQSVNRSFVSADICSKVNRRFALALVPIGVSMWAAHLLYHFATGWMMAGPVIKRALIGAAFTMKMPAIPSWLTQAQLLLLDVGLLMTLYVCWRIAKQYGERIRIIIGMLAPWAVTSCLLYAAGVWILFQPMQMRGMMMH
jgi:cytochrome c oxidase assembly factor CtaG/ferredoxin